VRADTEDDEDASIIRHDQLLIARPDSAIEGATDSLPGLPCLRTLETRLRCSEQHPVTRQSSGRKCAVSVDGAAAVSR
jgi:hypothetical protein